MLQRRASCTRPAVHARGRQRPRLATRGAAATTGGPGPGDEPVSSTLRSLDSLLTAEEEATRAAQDEGPQRATAAISIDSALRDLQAAGLLFLTQPGVTIRQPKGARPVWSLIIYYWNIIIYGATWYLDTTEGPGAGADFRDQLVNDHLAVLQQGDVLRLFSAPLVHVTPLSLFITLAALGSIAVELEGLLGYWAFGLMAACVAVCGGLADALADTTPITQGPLPFVASVVGALCCTYARNALFEEQAAAALALPSASSTAAPSSASRTHVTTDQLVPPAAQQPSLSSRDTSDDVLGPAGAADKASSGTSITTAAAEPQASNPSNVKQQDRGPGGESVDEQPATADVEVLEGLFKFELPTTAAGKAAAAIATGAVAAGEVLYDMIQGEGATASPTGMVVGLVIGIALGLTVTPHFVPQRMPLIAALQRLSQELPFWVPPGAPRLLLANKVKRLLAVQQQRGTAGPEVVLVTDNVPPLSKFVGVGALTTGTIAALITLVGL